MSSPNLLELLQRARFALGFTQNQLAESLGSSRRTGQRWSAAQSSPSQAQLSSLVVALYPVDATLARLLAPYARTTVEALGLVVAPPPPVVEPAPGTVLESSSSLLADSVVCAAGTAIDLSPRLAREALLAAFIRARQIGFTLETLEAALRLDR